MLIEFLGEKIGGVVSFGLVASNGKADDPVSSGCSKKTEEKKSLCQILYCVGDH